MYSPMTPMAKSCKPPMAQTETMMEVHPATVWPVQCTMRKYSSIKMLTAKNHVTITTSSPDLGSAQEEVEAKYDSEALEIGYNFRYLLDILAEVKGDSVRISFADGSSPSVIHDTSDSSAIYVLMPMRV